MTSSTHALTASNIKYLITLYELSPENTGIRCVKIAQTLGITKPSVHAMINTLMHLELVQKSRYGVVAFTKQGFEFARRYMQYYTSISEAIGTYLSDDAERKSAVCAMMAAVTPEQLEKMCIRMEQK